MKTFTKLSFVLLAFLAINVSNAQTTPLKITVDWEDRSYENKVEVYDQANNLVYTICNTDECFQTTGTIDIYTGTYDLGCVQNGNYYLKLYNANSGETSWADGYVSVEINGVTAPGFPNSGSTVNDGSQYLFTVTSDGTPCNSLTDTDGDGVIDSIDIDDDNDGIHDVDEGLGIDIFNCTIPALNFAGNNNTAETGTAGQVGAIYRFANAIFGEPYDVLVEIIEKHDDATLSTIDNDGTDNVNYLQTEVTFTGNETPSDCPTCDYPGITFKFTIVDAGTSNPATTLFSIGGTTWDVDGGTSYRESVRYYNPSAYGVDNPTTVQVTDVNGDASEIEMTAGGILEGPGFSTLSQLRSYFQFRLDATNDSFSLRMQNVRTTYTSSSTRQYGMSFTQCDVLDFKAASIIIVNGEDSDGDGIDNNLDIDSDNDGIPDNIEGQPTVGYIAPNFNNVPYENIDPITGADTAYNFELALPDTDGDGTADFLDLDSDGDGTPDIEENGSAFDVLDIIPNVDIDGDGLNNNFDDVPGVYDINDEITTGTLAELIASFLDSDSDIGSLGGDLDYRDASDFESATIDFDGENDYVDSSFDFSGMAQTTVMAWIKLHTDFSSTGTIINQGEFLLEVNGDGKISTKINAGSLMLPEANNLVNNKWYHVAVVFDSASAGDNLSVYLNGELIDSVSHPSLDYPIETWPGEFTIGKTSTLNNNYFKGAIDEVRVFDIALTEDQLQQIVFQEIEENGTLVRGKIIPKDIADFTSNATVSWSNLSAYYPMTNILTGKTFDNSNNSRHAQLHNITTIQKQTAPMPYQTSMDGNWNNASDWLYGNVWDIQDLTSVKPWAIFKISHNVSVSSSIKSYGLIIDDEKTLTVTGDNEINNSWYLKLDGTIDLSNDSQLVQGEYSELETDEDGNILRRQEGNSNYFRYNYWSSPVGALAATNNANTNYKINMIKDGTGADIDFTNAYNEAGKISRTWLYTFQNGKTYYDWVSINETSDIIPGMGYTQKGTQSADGEQNYIFEGKPNNGTILIPADDVENDATEDGGIGESVVGTTLTTSLIGNPYPSAIDARTFIDNNLTDKVDNGELPIINGTILLWEHWAGDSHYLAEYEGGYGYINLSTTERAYQDASIALYGQVDGLGEGIKRPTFYIPVGQGFIVEVVNDGHIEFNNSQRVFIEESDVLLDQDDANYETNGSSFLRSTNTDASANNQETNPLQLIRMEFATSEGSTRRFAIGFGDHATDGLDSGLDGGLILDKPEDDMGSLLNGKQYVIQTLAPITNDKEVNLTLNASGNYSYSLKAVQLKNIADDQEIYLRDNLTGSYFDLRKDQGYNFTSNAGEFNDRFDVVFQSADTLSNEDFTTDNTLIYVNNVENMLYVKGLTTQAKQVSLTNMLGQTIKTFNNIDNQVLENGINISNLSSGVYLVNVKAENGTQLSKKVILD